MIGLLRGGAAGAALAVVTVGLASTLAACASSTNAANGSPVGAAGTTSGSTVTNSPTPTSTTPPSPPSTINPGGPMSPVPTAPPASPSPGSVLTAPPAKSRYAPIDQKTQSADGRTLYLEIEARGGACGQYVVVLQQSASEVRVGLAQLEPKVGVMCPNFIGPRTFSVSLSSPVGTRPVIDLATGRKI